MKKTMNRMLFAALSLFLVTSLSLLGGCGTKGKEDNCDQFHKKKTECDNYTTKAGVKCKYNDATDKCQPEAPAVVCEELDDITCQGSDQCTFDSTTTPKCKEAAAGVKGTCKAYQTQTSCEGNTCKWDTTTSLCNDQTSRGPDKKIQEYTLAKIAKADDLGDNELYGIAASGDGKFIYLMGFHVIDYLYSFDVDAGGKWYSQTLSNRQIRQAQDFNADHDFRKPRISHWAPLSDGLLVGIKGKGIVQVIGKGGDNSIYAWDVANELFGLGEFNKGGTNFLLYSIKRGSDRKVGFLKKQTDPAKPYVDDWDESLVEEVGQKLKSGYAQFLQYGNDEMLMMDRAGEFVDLIEAANIGVPNGKITAPGFIVNDTAWALNGTDNTAKKLAFIDNKFVIAIFNEPGIAVYDKTSGGDISLATSWKWLDKTTATKDIVVDKHSAAKDKRAIVTASAPSGFMVLEGNQLLEPVPGHKLINNTNIALSVTTYQNAASGFTASSVGLPSDEETVYDKLAQDKNGLFYLQLQGGRPTTGGVYTLEIKDKVIPAP